MGYSYNFCWDNLFYSRLMLLSQGFINCRNGQNVISTWWSWLDFRFDVKFLVEVAKIEISLHMLTPLPLLVYILFCIDYRTTPKLLPQMLWKNRLSTQCLVYKGIFYMRYTSSGAPTSVASDSSAPTSVCNRRFTGHSMLLHTLKPSCYIQQMNMK